jgi:hypothetical protein
MYQGKHYLYQDPALALLREMRVLLIVYIDDTLVLMKVVFNDRSPLPRYTCTLNVQTVLSYISSLGNNDSLSLKQLSCKTAMPLSLTRPFRSADVSQLSLHEKQYI